jgi:hypothetical protein
LKSSTLPSVNQKRDLNKIPFLFIIHQDKDSFPTLHHFFDDPQKEGDNPDRQQSSQDAPQPNQCGSLSIEHIDQPIPNQKYQNQEPKYQSGLGASGIFP